MKDRRKTGEYKKAFVFPENISAAHRHNAIWLALNSYFQGGSRLTSPIYCRVQGPQLIACCSPSQIGKSLSECSGCLFSFFFSLHFLVGLTARSNVMIHEI
jgi:hypothetical protein